MTDRFTLADVHSPTDRRAVAKDHFEYELRYRDGSRATRSVAYTDHGFDDDIDWMVREELRLRLEQPRPPECDKIGGFIWPELITDIEDTWNDYDDECGCRGACFCYGNPHDVVDPQRSNAIWSLSGCTKPATIATWRWRYQGTGGTDTIYMTGLNRQSFVELWEWLPEETEDDA